MHLSQVEDTVSVKDTITRLWVALFLALVITGFASAQGREVISGTFSNGQRWAVATPSPIANWNGTLILDLDAVPAVNNNTALAAWLVSKGYAYGGIDRTIVTYRYDIGADNLVMVREQFINHYRETPTRTIAYGVSRGSNIARFAIQKYPDIFVGAATGMGGGGGQLSSMLNRLDSQFVLKTLVDPASPVKIILVPNTPAGIAAEEAELGKLVAQAASTALGRARLALAGAVSQTGPWLLANAPEPAPKDYDAQLAQLVATYVDIQGVNVAAGASEIAGGNILWNNGVNYRRLLARSGREDFVEAMYDKAGNGRHLLEVDLRRLENAPRISADPALVSYAEKFLSFTGQVGGPVYSVNNIGDINYPPSKEIAYLQTLRRAGNGRLHQFNWVRSAGHGNLNATELIVGLSILFDRLDTGKWHYESVEEHSALAEKIRSESTVALPPARFMNYYPDRPLRPWDVRNHDTYDPHYR